MVASAASQCVRREPLIVSARFAGRGAAGPRRGRPRVDLGERDLIDVAGLSKRARADDEPAPALGTRRELGIGVSGVDGRGGIWA